MGEFSLSGFGNDSYGKSGIFYPELSADESGNTYQGTTPFQSDRAYSHMTSGGLVDVSDATYNAGVTPTPFGMANLLLDPTETFGNANRSSWTFFSSEPYHQNGAAYPKAVRSGFFTIILTSSVFTDSSASGFGYQQARTVIPTTLVVLRNLGDYKVFDIPIKVYDENNNIVANGTLKTRVTFTYSRSLGNTGYSDGHLSLCIDSKFTGTNSMSDLHPTIGVYYAWTTGRRILDYDDYPMEDSIPDLSTNDIATCAYTQ